MSIANQFKRAEALNKSTAARMDVLAKNAELDTLQKASPKEVIVKPPRAGTQALPVDTTIPKQKRGRPPTGFDPKEYHRLYQRDKRAADKLGISVKELRSQKGQGK